MIIFFIIGIALGHIFTSDRRYSNGYEAGYEDALYFETHRKTND